MADEKRAPMADRPTSREDYAKVSSALLMRRYLESKARERSERTSESGK